MVGQMPSVLNTFLLFTWPFLTHCLPRPPLKAPRNLTFPLGESHTTPCGHTSIPGCPCPGIRPCTHRGSAVFPCFLSVLGWLLRNPVYRAESTHSSCYNRECISAEMATVLMGSIISYRYQTSLSLKRGIWFSFFGKIVICERNQKTRQLLFT